MIVASATRWRPTSRPRSCVVGRRTAAPPPDDPGRLEPSCALGPPLRSPGRNRNAAVRHGRLRHCAHWSRGRPARLRGLVPLPAGRHGRLGAARCGTTAVVVAWSQPQCRGATWSPPLRWSLPHAGPQCRRVGRMVASALRAVVAWPLQHCRGAGILTRTSVLRKRSVASGRSAWDARFAIVWGSGRGRPSRRAIGLANIDIPRGMQAVQAWRRLDRRIRWAVARRGRAS
jgi:hypothetical protein